MSDSVGMVAKYPFKVTCITLKVTSTSNWHLDFFQGAISAAHMLAARVRAIQNVCRHATLTARTLKTFRYSFFQRVVEAYTSPHPIILVLGFFLLLTAFFLPVPVPVIMTVLATRLVVVSHMVRWSFYLTRVNTASREEVLRLAVGAWSALQF